VGQEIHALADVVWPGAEAQRLRATARHLADVVEQQQANRTKWADHARDGWDGRFRVEWDASESVAVTDAQVIIARLRSLADALDRAEHWVADEDAARSRARAKEADDQTWFGLKDNVMTMAKTYIEVRSGGAVQVGE
jgi:hypothetical protein